VHARHDLHQTLRADVAFGKRVVARFDGDDGQQQLRVHPLGLAQRVCAQDERARHVLGDAVLARQVVAQGLKLCCGYAGKRQCVWMRDQDAVKVAL